MASEFICPGVVQVRFLWLTFAGRGLGSVTLLLIDVVEDLRGVKIRPFATVDPVPRAGVRVGPP